MTAAQGDTDLQVREPLSVLLLDDDEFDRRRIKRMSNASGLSVNMQAVATLEAMNTALSTASFDIILVDYQLAHGTTGLDALTEIQTHPAQSNARKIMITGDQRQDIAINAFKLGCNDFLEKDKLTPEVLRSSVLAATQSRNLGGAFDDRVSKMPNDGLPWEMARHEMQRVFVEMFQDSLHSPAMKSTVQLWFLEAFQQAARDIDLTKHQTQAVTGDAHMAELLHAMRDGISTGLD